MLELMVFCIFVVVVVIPIISLFLWGLVAFLYSILEMITNLCSILDKPKTKHKQNKNTKSIDRSVEQRMNDLLGMYESK